MRIAIFQNHISWENKEKNYLCLEQKLKELSDKCPQLVLLPEMSFTGFSMNTNLTGESSMETVSVISSYAKKHGVAIGFGWVKNCGEKAENHYSIVDKSGSVISDYVKIHPFSFSGEDKKFKGGEEINVFEFDGIKFSTFICYDLRFPEVFQIASKKAHVIIVPANWPRKRREHWKCLLRARAIENQVYIIGVNCVGDIGGVEYSGDSCVINPNGEVLIESFGEDSMIMYELLDDVDHFRNAFRVKDDRREEIYSKCRKGRINESFINCVR